MPISAIIMSLVLGPLITVPDCWRTGRSKHRWLQSMLEIGHGISNDMARMEKRFHGHVLVFVVMAASAALALNGGLMRSIPVLTAHFDEKLFPIKAAQFIAQADIRDHLFSSDTWSAYLIYQLYPDFKVYFDDRHDFYGEAFVKEYGKAFLATRQWEEPLDRYQVRWVLMPTDAPLSTVLRRAHDWCVVYDDGLAILFSRAKVRAQ
jgi:hypothetical protein